MKLVHLSWSVVLACAYVGVCQAGPNETCADQAIVERVIQIEKDETAFGQDIKRRLQAALAPEIIGPSYGFSHFANDLTKHGLQPLIDRWVDDLTNDKLCGKTSCPPEAKPKTKQALLTVLEPLKIVQQMYDRYFVEVSAPIATHYDRDLERVVCRLTYRMNTAEFTKLATDPEDIRFFKMLSALQKDLSVEYAIQPNGKGGSTVQIMTPRR